MLKLIYTFSFVTMGIVFSTSVLNKDVVSSVTEIILSNLKNQNIAVNIMSGKIDEACDREVLHELCFKIGSQIPFRIINNNEFETIKEKLFHNVIYFASLDAFREFFRNIKNQYFHFAGNFVIIYDNATSNDLEEMFKILWNLYIYNINVITRNQINSSVSVSTFVPFSERGCNNTNPVKIAEFFNSTFQFRPPKFFFEKFGNFHTCVLKVSTFESLAPSVLKEDFVNGSFRLYGRDINVLNALAAELNFTYTIDYITPYGGWGTLFANGSATGAMGKAIRRESDAVFGNIFLKYERSKFMDYSYSYFVDQLVFMIPPGKKLTSFQKLIRPFEILVWMLLGVTVLCSFIIIAILQLQPNSLKEFVFGTGNKTPYLNVFVAIFGGSQWNPPSRNFSRFLLMMFILFCLVLR